MENLLSKNEDLGKLILRVTVGGLMIFHGTHKLIHGHDFIRFHLKEHDLPEWFSLGVPVGEVIAPMLLLLGLFTRIASVLVIITMLISIWLFYGAEAFLLGKYGGLNSELNLFFLLTSFAILFIGAGNYSLTEVIRRNTKE